MLLCACARFCSALAVARIVLSTLSLDAAAARSEYAEDLVRQGCDIDLDPQAGRRAQDEAAETKTGLAKMLQTNPDCSWDTFDGKCMLLGICMQVHSVHSSEAAESSAIRACCRRSCDRDECGMLRWKC